MFRDTVFKNIAFSDPDTSVEEVIHAADIANAHQFIVRLPDAPVPPARLTSPAMSARRARCWNPWEP